MTPPAAAPEGRQIMMQTRYAVPVEEVWAAIVDPARVARWYGGDGFSSPKCEMDVRVGGRWSHVMRTPDGADHALEFVFVEVDPPHTLSWRGADPDDPHTPLNTIRLAPVDAATELHFTAVFPSAADRQAAEAYGFRPILEQGFGRLAEVLGLADRKETGR